MAAKKSTAKKTVSAPTSSPVRNTPIPKVAAAPAVVAKVPTQEEIARRAFEIYAGGTGGSETDNWFRAERELRGL
jgi:hypothetical protein